MTAKELRQKFLDFFKEKGHAVIPSASLIPEDNFYGLQKALFTTAGMHPLVPYLLGEAHPEGKRLANCQKCLRTIDIDEVGNATHHTFFEMLGNWSLGDYFKKEAVEWSWEFLTSPKGLNLDKNRIAVSVFAGDQDAPFDEESYNIWKSLGVPEKRIAKLPKKNNWWGPAGETGPCGPDTEMFYWVGEKGKIPESFNDDNDLWVEIWNDVFMEYNKASGGKYEKLMQKNVDTGMGLERMLAVMSNLDDNYKSELFWPIIEKIQELSGKKYKGNEKTMRIIADHIKASVFLIAEGIEPSNVQRGYVLRKLIRRAVRYSKMLEINNNFTAEVVKVVKEIYRDAYPEVLKKNIPSILEEEENKFGRTLNKGLKEFEGISGYSAEELKERTGYSGISGYNAFDLYQTYGFPFEMTKELAAEKGLKTDEDGFKKELEKHQQLSKTASAGMFKGGLADTKDKTTELHTTAHLMLAGLRKVLGKEVHQKGSNINGERIRFDFSHPEKLTLEQKKAVEDFVNSAISAKLPVTLEELSLDEAKASGAEGAFEHKYGDRVKVYTIDSSAQDGSAYSREICGGPHVANTGDIKGKFKITKEESSSAGVRRIKAVVE